MQINIIYLFLEMLGENERNITLAFDKGLLYSSDSQPMRCKISEVCHNIL
jgi:hypothetical protein